MAEIVAKSPRGPAKVLLIRLSALGDVCHALPLPGAIKRLHPGARVWWAVEEAAAPLLGLHPDLDGVIVIPRRRLGKLLRRPLRWGELGRELSRLRLGLHAHKFDAVIDAQGNLRSALVARATSSPLRIGPSRSKEGAGFAYTRLARAPGPAHKVDRGLRLLAALASDGCPPEAVWPVLELPEEALRRARELRAAESIVLHPGVSRFGAFKAWPIPRWQELAAALRADGFRLLVSAGPGEESAASLVAEAGAGELVRTDLLGLAAVLQSCRALVACDSGPLHLASALGARVVGLYGPKDPATYGPRGPGDFALVVRNGIPCSPCGRRRCPVPLCMTGLGLAEVRSALEAALAGREWNAEARAWPPASRWFLWPAPVGDLARAFHAFPSGVRKGAKGVMD